MNDEHPQALNGVNSSSPSLPSDGAPIGNNIFEIRLPLERFRSFFDAFPDALVITNQNGQILYVNGQAEQDFGYVREELLGSVVETLVPERFRDSDLPFHCVYQEHSRSDPNRTGQEMCGLRKDGSEFAVEIRSSPIRTESGLLICSVVRTTGEHAKAREVEARLAFEETVSGLSAKFINLPADKVDEEINEGLRTLSEALDADRTTLGMISPTTGDIVITHSWTRPGFPQFGDRILKGILPWIEARIRSGQLVSMETLEDFPPEALNEREYARSFGIKSGLLAPFQVGGKVIGAFGIDHFRKHVHWDPFILLRVGDIADIFANAMARKQADDSLHHAFSTIERLKEQLEQENSYLRQEIKLEHSHTNVVGNSAAIRGVLKSAEQVAATDSVVLILGETGTGKELLARTIHEMSGRKNRAMVKINCAALPATLIESELFGREKGAYTGALARQIGRFELADQSTIFLDEIGELPLEVQVKLLRVLQEGELERLGGPKTIKVDVRVIAATSRNLQAMVRDGLFREDLFYRLNVFPILIPPLRERAEDIPALVWHILKDLGKRMGRNIESMQATTLRRFLQYPWPGNVRELRNVIERNLILSSGNIFRAEVPILERSANSSLRHLDEVESEYFRKVLGSTHWRVRGKGGAAEVLGLKATTLEARMKKLGIQRPT